MKLFSPAKLNLFFQVLHKREDGFHEIASLFQAISLGDTLTLSLSSTDSFTCPTLPTDHTNLVIKALTLFRQKTGITHPVSIHLEKKIPIEAGLGGGSSNAATTLWALNHLFHAGLPDSTLASWGAEIGSDVPFFFSTGTALCRGRGEILQNQTLPPFSAYLAKPNYGSKTPAVYHSMDYTKLHKFDTQQVVSSFLQGKPIFFNDLEESAQRLEPRLIEFKRQLQAVGFSEVVMSGSGTSYFCIGTPKFIPDTFFCKIHSVQRKEGSWYEG